MIVSSAFAILVYRRVKAISSVSICFLGHKDAALEWLERAQFHHEGAVIWVQADPRFDSLREEPRFKDLLRRMGLGAAQRSGG